MRTGGTLYGVLGGIYKNVFLQAEYRFIWNMAFIIFLDGEGDKCFGIFADQGEMNIKSVVVVILNFIEKQTRQMCVKL